MLYNTKIELVLELKTVETKVEALNWYTVIKSIGFDFVFGLY